MGRDVQMQRYDTKEVSVPILVQRPLLYLGGQLLLYLELILANTTEGAYIIVGEVLECYTWFNTLLWVTNLRVIDPLTYCTDILFHNYPDLNIKQSLGNICSCMEFVKVHALFVSNANLTHLIKKQQSAILK